MERPILERLQEEHDWVRAWVIVELDKALGAHVLTADALKQLAERLEALRKCDF